MGWTPTFDKKVVEHDSVKLLKYTDLTENALIFLDHLFWQEISKYGDYRRRYTLGFSFTR